MNKSGKNRTWIAVLVGALLISTVGFGIHHISATTNGDAQVTSSEVRERIENNYPGEITELELERENGQLVYEVEVEGPDGEYEIKIDASDGRIVKIEETSRKASKVASTSAELRSDARETTNTATEHDNTDNTDNNETNAESRLMNQATTNAEDQRATNERDDECADRQHAGQREDKHPTKTRISIQEAMEIALNEVPGTIDEVELERDDGWLIYEVEIETNRGEAEVEVDAYTGEIIMISWDD